jgi:hypothetical protein
MALGQFIFKSQAADHPVLREAKRGANVQEFPREPIRPLSGSSSHQDWCPPDGLKTSRPHLRLNTIVFNMRLLNTDVFSLSSYLGVASAPGLWATRRILKTRVVEPPVFAKKRLLLRFK